jgi:hypothetical protein
MPGTTPVCCSTPSRSAVADPVDHIAFLCHLGMAGPDAGEPAAVDGAERRAGGHPAHLSEKVRSDVNSGQKEGFLRKGRLRAAVARSCSVFNRRLFNFQQTTVQFSTKQLLIGTIWLYDDSHQTY